MPLKVNDGDGMVTRREMGLKYEDEWNDDTRFATS